MPTNEGDETEPEARGGTSNYRHVTLGDARYRIGTRIGRGGMGDVVSAEDVEIGRDVAIKRMLGDANELAITRFMREARIQGRLEHPAIVPVHGLGIDAEDRPYFVMQKLAGTTLEQALTRPDKFSRQRLLRALADVCLAIELAHTRGVIHRDIKPANIMLGDFGEVYVLDWGVAKLLGGGDTDEFPMVPPSELGTQVGALVGTPGYMSPEQVRGEQLDGRTDVYALGSVLFEILAGQRLHPKGAEAIQTTLDGAEQRASQRALQADVPPELDDLCTRATASDRNARIVTARELGESIQHYLDGDRDLAQRRELASRHFAAAQRAFAGGSADDRSVAMREAGRAIALDPTLHEAAELVTRLMLEPPSTVPREVEAALVEDSNVSSRRHARTVGWYFATYFGLLPYLIASRGYDALVITLMAVLMIGMTLRAARQPSRYRTAIIAVRNTIVLAIVARGLSPFGVAPVLAVTVTSMLMYVVTVDTPRHAVAIAGAMIAVTLGPWVLERIGVLSSTMEMTADGYAFHTGINTMSIALREGGLALLVAGSIAACTLLGYRMRRADLDSRRLLRLQAWQLRQLVS